MSSVRGTISVDLAFTDSTTVSGAQSLKTITLRDATEYTSTSGVVAILQGTAGTAAVTLASAGAGITTTYKNASGDAVTLNAVSRIAYKWVGSGLRALTYVDDGSDVVRLISTDGIPALSFGNNFIGNLQLAAGSGTGSYTVVIYSAS